MKKIKSLIEKASQLINTSPLPDDAEEQLEKIIEQANDETEKFMLSSFTESLFVIRNE